MMSYWKTNNHQDICCYLDDCTQVCFPILMIVWPNVWNFHWKITQVQEYGIKIPSNCKTTTTICFNKIQLKWQVECIVHIHNITELSPEVNPYIFAKNKFVYLGLSYTLQRHKWEFKIRLVKHILFNIR